ncbi:hypothetical protein B2G88_01740 [Natronolimnobius baerhuensis]|uniref:Uncharacterized protein n=2 Tax=Natronolimnobius baerhuensis TaxID=253108 RepID=A0A202EBF5_9EURY|nr:hypothetical protein B2G88_01740 [Natronolimnobius baerhuensis]
MTERSMGDETHADSDENPLRELIGFVEGDELEAVKRESHIFRSKLRGENDQRPQTVDQLKSELLGGDDGSA